MDIIWDKRETYGKFYVFHIFMNFFHREKAFVEWYECKLHEYLKITVLNKFPQQKIIEFFTYCFHEPLRPFGFDDWFLSFHGYAFDQLFFQLTIWIKLKVTSSGQLSCQCSQIDPNRDRRRLQHRWLLRSRGRMQMLNDCWLRYIRFLIRMQQGIPNRTGLWKKY